MPRSDGSAHPTTQPSRRLGAALNAECGTMLAQRVTSTPYVHDHCSWASKALVTTVLHRHACSQSTRGKLRLVRRSQHTHSAPGSLSSSSQILAAFKTANQESVSASSTCFHLRFFRKPKEDWVHGVCLELRSSSSCCKKMWLVARRCRVVHYPRSLG